MNPRDWFDDDRKYAIGILAAVAGYALYETMHTGKLLEFGWPHPLVIIGILSTVICVGLSLRQEWSRWVGYMFCLASTVLGLSQILYSGFSPHSLLAFCAGPLGIWYFWQLPLTELQRMARDPQYAMKQIEHRLESFNTWKLVLLLDKAPAIDVHALAEMAQQAFGHPFDVIDQEIDPTDSYFLPSEQNGPVVTGIAPIFVCYQPPHLLNVCVVPSSHPELATEDWESDSAEFQAVASHCAVVEIEILPSFGNLEPVNDGFAVTGKLAAAMIEANCLGLYAPGPNRIIAMSSKLIEALQGGHLDTTF